MTNFLRLLNGFSAIWQLVEKRRWFPITITVL